MAPTLTGTRCASVHGFSLHANPQVPAPRRDPLARLSRSTARRAVSPERLLQATNGALVYPFTHAWADGPTGMRRSPGDRVEKLAALVPLPRVPRVRSGGCLATHRSWRRALTPPPCSPGIAEPEASPEAPGWSWARLLKRVFAWAMARGPWGPPGPLRIIAALTPGAGGWTLLRPLKRAADPPPLAPARVHPAACAWAAAGARLVWRGPCPARWLVGAPRPGGETAWPRGGGVLYGQQPARAARPGSVSPPGSQRLA